MNDSPLFSVIINCHNGEEFLQETLDSIWTQTFQDYEVIYWDNQSTDKSYQIANSQKKSNLRCFKSVKFTPLGEARNQAVERAKGKWICFLDADDLWKPNKLLRQSEIIKGNPDYGVIYGNFDQIDKNGGIIIKSCIEESDLKTGLIYQYLIKKNFIGLLTATIKRDAYTRIEKIPSNLNNREDHFLFLKLSKFTKFYSIKASDCKYRIHEHNISKNRFESYNEAIFIRKYFKEISTVKSIQLKFKIYAYFLFYKYFSKFNKIKKKRKKSIYIWGTGKLAKETLNNLVRNGIKISGIYDNDKNKRNLPFQGIDVFEPPTSKRNIDKQYIIIASSFYSEISKQLKNLGFIYKKDFIYISLKDFEIFPSENKFFDN